MNRKISFCAAKTGFSFKVILLIDEYDVPLAKAFERQMEMFIRSCE